MFMFINLIIKNINTDQPRNRAIPSELICASETSNSFIMAVVV